jgi:hypothetical protein
MFKDSSAKRRVLFDFELKIGMELSEDRYIGTKDMVAEPAIEVQFGRKNEEFVQRQTC